MGAFVPPSASPSHYSKETIGFLAGAGALVLILCMCWAYVYHKSGPTEMLRARRERREAKRKARDIEMAETAANAERVVAQDRREKMIIDQQAQEMLEAVWKGNTLVGSTPPRLPQRVGFSEELRPQQVHVDEKRWADRTRQLKLKDGEVVPKDSLDLAIDPMSYTVGSGKDMAAFYRE